MTEQKDTRQLILEKALELFNKQGIEYAGMRELAAALDIRVGNITYYFPTKDELVFELSKQLSAANAGLFVTPQELTLLQFFENRKLIFKNQNNYRCLQLSFVHLLQQNKLIRANYDTIKLQRMEGLRQTIRTLQKNGFIKIPAAQQEVFVSLVAMTGRLWISEAEIAHPNLTAEAQMKLYLATFAGLFQAYATRTGKNAVKKFLAGL